ncbi:alpha/beta fold hydrolase [Streptomyces sp. RKAG293]|uniref:alpha/beta fold hydrolase n=1 Tax=Streptomyces sp. RKAG293 TaxID=2893403 RepID=UPI002033BF35|nr:alpha/beta hydrolase [Streptomyces sp. RKAG293]MCM2422172.1 alpha/beta hydrolase [Streptomyces sp. RKAG293]
MPGIELSAGTIDFEDTGGSGPVVVLLHGLGQSGTVWKRVVDDLRTDHRCVIPDLPTGGHRRPMRPDAELSLRSVALLVGEFLERLELHGVTLVENDSGHAQVLAGERPERIGRLVITSGEAFENYPPGAGGKMLTAVSRIPGGVYALAHFMNLRALRGLPVGFRPMSVHGVPHEMLDDWLRPLLTDRAIRADLRRYLLSARKGAMLEAAERLRKFDRPALVVWAEDDRMMPRAHGRRLADLLPQGRLVEIPDCRTLIPVDQPAALAAALREFIGAEG